MSDPTYRDLLYFFVIAVCYCVCCNGLFGILLRLFYFPHFLHLDWHDLPYTMSTMPRQLETDDTGSVTSLEIIGKSICPSCKKQHEHLEYICTSEICQGIIYINAFSRRFNPKRLTEHSGYTFICQYVCSLGIEPTTFYVTNMMLYHWATGTYPSINLLSAYTVNMICK